MFTHCVRTSPQKVTRKSALSTEMQFPLSIVRMDLKSFAFSAMVFITAVLYQKQPPHATRQSPVLQSRANWEIHATALPMFDGAPSKLEHGVEFQTANFAQAALSRTNFDSLFSTPSRYRTLFVLKNPLGLSTILSELPLRISNRFTPLHPFTGNQR